MDACLNFKGFRRRYSGEIRLPYLSFVNSDCQQYSESSDCSLYRAENFYQMTYLYEFYSTSSTVSDSIDSVSLTSLMFSSSRFCLIRS